MTKFELRAVWQADDAIVSRDVVALWDETSAVAPRDRADRLKEIVAAAYDKAGRIIGACTARPIEYKVLRARVFLLRSVILPGTHHDHVFLNFLSVAKAVLQAWASSRPDERFKGILTMFDSDAYDAFYPEPILRRLNSELVLTGYTDGGRQIRMQWFDDARLEK